LGEKLVWCVRSRRRRRRRVYEKRKM